MSKRTKLKSAAEIASNRILDSRGNTTPSPKPNAGIHDGSYPTRYKPRFNWVTNEYSRDFKYNVTSGDHRQLLSRARELTENVPSIKNAIREIADFVVGDAWYPKFHGEDEEWGKQATDWLLKWMNISTMGNTRSFQKSLKLSVISVLRDGDVLGVLTSTRMADYPQIQLIPSHRIGSGYNASIKGGKYDGLAVCNGVIYNKYGEAVAYNIQGVDGNDTQVSIKDCQLIFDPEYVEQERGLTALAGAITNIDDYNTIKNFEIQALKHNASIAATMHVPQREIDDHAGEYSDSPDVQPVNSTVNSATKRQNTIESLQGGEVMMFRPEDGAKVEFLQSNRPGPNTSAFLLDHVLRHAFLSLRWPVELCYDLNSRGATTRLVASKAQRRIEQLQEEVVYPSWKRFVSYALAKAIKTGLLPENKDWYKFEPTYPKSFSVEQFKDVKSDLDLYNKAVVTGTQMAANEGYDYISNMEQKAKELKAADDIAKKYGLSRNDLIMATANGNAVKQEAPKESPKETEEE